MADFEEYRFEIPAYTPETIPLDRLLSYLAEVAILLGDPKEMHLLRIETASAQPVIAMPRRAALKARQKVEEVRNGGGSERRRNAFTRIRGMVEEDGGGPALLIAPEGATILKFDPPRQLGPAVHGIRQEGTIQGRLMRVGGIQENSRVLLESDSGEVISGCYANRRLAKDLGNYLFQMIRLSGVGTWMRSPDGKWSLERMQVQSFYTLDERPLSDIVHELQAIPVDWPRDTLQRLRDLRSEN